MPKNRAYENRTTVRDFIKLLCNDSFDVFIDKTNGIIYQCEEDGQYVFHDIDSPRELIKYYDDEIEKVGEFEGVTSLWINSPSRLHRTFSSVVNTDDLIPQEIIDEYARILAEEDECDLSEDELLLLVTFNQFKFVKKEDQYII